MTAAPDYLAESVTPTIAAQVLWHFEGPAPPSLKPGSFIASLIDTIAHADPTNQARLALGFPGYVMAVSWAQNFADGIGELRAIARGTRRTSITCPDCGMTSHHPEDVAQGYCGNCHKFTSPPFGARA